MTTITKPENNAHEFNSFKLAIAVLADRIVGLPQSDKDDLFELTRIVFSAASEEERQSAMRAMDEIMEQRPLSLVKVDESEDAASLDGWLTFISDRIREVRMAANLTQAELAERSGLTQSHISRLENGEHSPSQATIKRIADALGIATSHLDPCAE